MEPRCRFGLPGIAGDSFSKKTRARNFNEDLPGKFGFSQMEFNFSASAMMKMNVSEVLLTEG